MKKKYFVTAVAVIASIAILGASASIFAAQEYQCDRECLVKFMKDYLAALVKHDTKAVPWAYEVKFVENTADIPVGKGLWTTASGGPSDFQIYAADPEAQQVACLVMMKENNNQDVLLGARLKLENLKIREAEHLAIRDLTSSAMGQSGLKSLQKPRPGLLEDVAPSDRMERWQLLNIGRSYYDALTGENGKLAPFADECERHENGMTTAGGPPPEPNATPKAKEPAAKPNPEFEKMMAAMAALGPAARSCEGQISTGAFAYITEILDRRVLIADTHDRLSRERSICLRCIFIKSKRARFMTSKPLASHCPMEPSPAGNRIPSPLNADPHETHGYAVVSVESV
jgi:hypothetical protein